MKGTAHALTYIDSLSTAIRREINQFGGKYIQFPVTEIVVKQTFYALHTTVNSQNLHGLYPEIHSVIFNKPEGKL